MGEGKNGELLVTYNKAKEKEAAQTLTRLKHIIDKHFPAESVEELQHFSLMVEQS